MKKPDEISILMVDDEPSNLDLLERTFALDYSVFRAESGDEALKMIPTIHNLAVIISDQRMPGLTGTELLMKARSLRSDAVRIILTGYTNPDDLIEAINSSNVYRYLTKPWKVDEMTAIVERAVRLFLAGGGELVDDATGFPNRGLLLREIEREIARANRTGTLLGVLALRIVGIAEYADRAGDTTAEALMRSVGDTICDNIRAMDFFGIYSREVFIACMPSCDSVEQIAIRLASVLNSLETFEMARSLMPSLAFETRHIQYHPDGKDVFALLEALGLRDQ